MRLYTICALCAILSVSLCVDRVGALNIDAAKLLELELPVPKQEGAAKYLSAGAGGSFRVGGIPAETLLIEVFSMYCPYCQAEAPKVNKLYGMVEADSKLAGKVKFLAVGSGNTPYEVEMFQKKFSPKFPMAPDPEFALEKCSGDRIRTPTFIILKKDGGKNFVVSEVHSGKIENLDTFFVKLAPN
jgi:thiol-disulfide isomerase/thioredoxin